MHIHTKYMQIHQLHTYTCIYIHIHTLTWAGLLYMHIHTYTCRYMQIHADTCIYIIYIHIQASVNYCQEVFLRGGSLRSLASGRIPTNQTCCDRPWGWIVVRGSCTGDLREEREGGSRGPGRVPRGGMRQIESAQTLPRAGKSRCSDALGCAECGPPTATPRDCV